jgi:hypothetical protein
MPCVQVEITKDAEPIDPEIPSGGSDGAKLLAGVSGLAILFSLRSDE